MFNSIDDYDVFHNNFAGGFNSIPNDPQYMQPFFDEVAAYRPPVIEEAKLDIHNIEDLAEYVKSRLDSIDDTVYNIEKKIDSNDKKLMSYLEETKQKMLSHTYSADCINK